MISHTGLALIINRYSDYEHPEVLPQPSQTKHEPAIRIFTPQVMQRGASEVTPLIFSKSSIEEPTSRSDGALSIFTSTLLDETGAFATGLNDADCAAAATISLIAEGSGVYSPVSSARWRSDDV